MGCMRLQVALALHHCVHLHTAAESARKQANMAMRLLTVPAHAHGLPVQAKALQHGMSTSLTLHERILRPSVPAAMPAMPLTAPRLWQEARLRLRLRRRRSMTVSAVCSLWSASHSMLLRGALRAYSRLSLPLWQAHLSRVHSCRTQTRRTSDSVARQAVKLACGAERQLLWPLHWRLSTSCASTTVADLLCTSAS